MDIFVTGATGVLGRAVVPMLIAEGHRVRGLARSEENRVLLRTMGAEPVAADLFAADSLQHVLAGCDVAFHLATHIPPTSKVGRIAAWQENDHIRREGTRALVAAALATGVQTLIYPSYYAVYPEGGDRWIAADTTPVEPHPVVQSTLDAEAAVTQFAADGRRGVVLRMGSLYGPDAPSARDLLRAARMGIAALPGPRDAYLPMIWVEDAAHALVAALIAPSGVYDVVDDEPLPRGELFAAIARSVGRARLRQLPRWLMGLLAGPTAEALGRSQRLSNRRFKGVTGWQPTVPNARIGFARIAGVPDSRAAPRTSAPVASLRRGPNRPIEE
jgi:nucleoside-diphosphate-sugar epimerase